MCVDCRIYRTPFRVVDAGAAIPGVVGDALGGIVVPVDVGIVPIVVFPVWCDITTVITRLAF